MLQEIVAADASLQMWFDRHLDFGHGSLIDSSLGNLPRLVTSRSIKKQHDDSRIVKKLDVKISVVERAINNIGKNIKPMTSIAKSQLNMFLQIDNQIFEWQLLSSESTIVLATEEANMTVLDTLNFVVFNPLSNNNPTAVRRRKLMAKIDEKIQLAINKDYTPTQHKWVTDVEGN